MNQKIRQKSKFDCKQKLELKYLNRQSHILKIIISIANFILIGKSFI